MFTNFKMCIYLVMLIIASYIFLAAFSFLLLNIHNSVVLSSVAWQYSTPSLSGWCYFSMTLKLSYSSFDSELFSIRILHSTLLCSLPLLKNKKVLQSIFCSFIDFPLLALNIFNLHNSANVSTHIRLNFFNLLKILVLS